MDPFGQTKFGVLTLGGVAAGLILWLSLSFWLDAWDQRQGARQFRQTAEFAGELLAVTRDLADERRTALTSLGAETADATSASALIEALARRSARLDRRLDAVLASIERALQDPLLTAGFRYSVEALESTLSDLEATRRAFISQRSTDTRLLKIPMKDGSRYVGLSGRERAMQRMHARASRLVDRLHELDDGLHIEARINVRSIQDLRRLRTDLRNFAEYAARASVLREAMASPVLSENEDRHDSWEAQVFEADLRVSGAIQRLRFHQSDAMLTPDLLRDLSALVQMASRGDPGRQSVLQALSDVDVRIARSIAAEIDGIEAHAHRRLFIDTLLIGVCFWIAISCMGLLRKIQHQAWHDRLTGLSNRSRFEQLLAEALFDASDESPAVVVLVLGLDNFTAVNTRVGHIGGDLLLCQFAERLRAALPTEYALAALGGDNFAASVCQAASVDTVMQLAERLRREGNRPFDVHGASVQVTLSIGVALSTHPEAGSLRLPARELLQQAELAMRQAKDGGRDRVGRFDPELAERNRRNIELENALRHAIEADQLELHYQPKVSMSCGRVDGAEALLRWQHPEQGTISPGVFVPIAERSGLIPAIGSWVLQEAIRHTARWNRDHSSALQIAVNVSAQQFLDDDFVPGIARLLEEHELAARYLELEVTESVGMIDMSLVVDKLQQLRGSGISIAIDDFGTDYSSLQYLDSLPLDKLKIDRAFVCQLDHGKGRSLAQAIVRMAESLGLQTVAEGVETPDQLDAILELGCDYVQGYYYSRPVPASQLSEVISTIEASSAEPLRPAA